MRTHISIGLLLIALGVIFLLTRGVDQKPDLDPQAVVAQVRRLNQLSTVRYTVQKVIGLKEQKQPIGEESILLVMQARVEAGIDLASLREQDIFRQPDGALVLRLPAARI